MCTIWASSKWKINPPPAAPDSDSDDCVFVEEVLPSPELQQKAEALLLPRTYYNYERAKSCPGCIGCDPESFDFTVIGIGAAADAMQTCDDGELLFGLCFGKS